MWDSCIRIKNSFSIIKLSLSYMWAHKILCIFPVLITVCISPLLIFVFLYAVDHVSEFPIFRMIFLLLVSYFASSFVTTLFGVAAAHVALKLFENEPESIFVSLKKSISKLKLIMEWSLLFSFMHFNLSALSRVEHEHESSEHLDAAGISRRKQITRAVGSIAEFAWELTVFLVLPIIAFERVHLAGLLNHALLRLKETFGDTIIAQFSFYSFNILAFSLSILAITLTTAYMRSSYQAGLYLTIGLIILCTVILSVLFIAQTIFKTAVYAFSINKPTGIFTESFIKRNFVGQA